MMLCLADTNKKTTSRRERLRKEVASPFGFVIVQKDLK